MKSIVSKTLFCFAIVILINGSALAQQQVFPSINYRLSMSRPVSHLFEVSIEVELPSDFKAESVSFQMPKWAPGRYAVFDFAKNVQEKAA